MPLFGAHMSIAGGYHKALEAARAHGCQAMQLFVSQPRMWPVRPRSPAKTDLRFGKFLTKNANQWRAKDLIDEEVQLFQETLGQTSIAPLLAHDSYLINLASADEVLYRRSIEAFIVEMERAERLGLTYLVTHPGAHVGSGEEAGLERVAAALDEVQRWCSGHRVRILLETTAGQGSCLGHRFEHLGHILSLVREPERLGVCLDTCHVFAAGYALAPESEYKKTLRAFDQSIGLERLCAFHLNDSLKPLGSRVDRHAHIGQGHLGLEPFRLLVNDRRFREHPMILETPKEDGQKKEMDVVNLRVLRQLVQKKSRVIRRGGSSDQNGSK
jgi:deoxyribonuclease-4